MNSHRNDERTISMKILLAEDEHELSRALVAVLEHNEYEVTAVFNGEEAVEAAKASTYDCFIFDIMMPVKDGISALKDIRAAGDITPALFLTAKSETNDKITGLDAGADDYLTKPFAMAELLARLRSLTRRRVVYQSNDITYGNVTLNMDNQEIKSENSIRLSSKEAHMLELFMRNPNKEIKTDELFNHIWKDESKTDLSAVWLYISYLNNKLSAIDADITITGEEGGSFALTFA